jgi:uncharacterized protein (DUF697 family)
MKKADQDTVVVEGVAAGENECGAAQVGMDDLSHEAKRAKVAETIKRNMLWSAGAGVLPIPMLELVAITAVELKLVKELADIYGAGYRKDLAKAAVLSLLGSLGSVTLGKMFALSSLKAIPVLGHVVSVASVPALAAAITYAIGRIFGTHFETGGTLLDFDASRVREYFRTEFANGMKVATETIMPKSAASEVAA